MIGKVRQTRSENFGVVNFLHFSRAVRHRTAHIEQDQNPRICLAFIELDVQLVGTSKHIPVDAFELIPGLVWAVLREVHAESQVRGLMKPGNESFDDGARRQLQVLNTHQNLGIDESILWTVDDWSAQTLSFPFLP